MGTPNTYTFNCPNCSKSVMVQIPGSCDTKKLFEACSCEAELLEGKESLCTNCGFTVKLSKFYGLRRSAYIEPLILKP